MGVPKIAQALGLAQRAFDLAHQYAKKRKQFDKPFASFQANQHNLSTAETNLGVTGSAWLPLCLVITCCKSVIAKFFPKL